MIVERLKKKTVNSVMEHRFLQLSICTAKLQIMEHESYNLRPLNQYT